jgi:UDP:flavonoid glycosyltransferase YjiC (YdhE family)
MPPRQVAPKQGSAAIICFAPDYGHVQPLLKIADALAEAGFYIRCYLPEQCAPLLQRFRFDAVFFETAHTPEQQMALTRIFSRSIFFNNVCSYAHYLLLRPPVMKAAGHFAAKLKQDLIEYRPDVIIGDPYWFREWSERIAASLDVALVINNPDGSLAYNQRTYVRMYGFNQASAALQYTVELAAAASKRLCATFYRLLYLRTWLKARATKRAADLEFKLAFPLAPKASARIKLMVIGSAPLERSRLRGIAKSSKSDMPEFPPFNFRSALLLSDELREWISQRGQDRPIVYVSFGTAVEIDSPFATAIYEGLRNVSASVLWRLPESQKRLLAALPVAENIRLEAFVPQAEILNLSQVQVFVTQAGSSSVQEALLGGTPMVCIPFFVDQAYNSSVVQHLHVGKRLWRGEISSRSVGSAVQDILANGSYLKAALEIRDELLRTDGRSAVASYIANVVQTSEAKRL